MTRPAPPKLLRSALPEILWPALPSQAATQLLGQMYQLEQSQWWPEATLRSCQLAQLGLLVRHAAAHSAFYEARFRGQELGAFGASDTLRWLAFQALPVLTRTELLTEAEGIHSRATPKQHGEVSVVQTSGSTGQVVAVRRTMLAQLMLFALGMRSHAWFARDFSQTLCVVRADSPHMDDDARARELGWGQPVNLLYATGPGYSLPLSVTPTEQADWLLRRDPGYLLTYPTNLAELLTVFERRGQRMPALLEVRSVGETVSPELRKRCAEVLGVRVVDGYSSQEVGVIALECPESGQYHVQSESLIVEILDDAGRPCEAGEIGRVVVTDLHNFATPLIRYDLADRAEVGRACPCGRGLPTLSRILGRERNMVTLPDGTRHWPLVGLHRFREIAVILQYQLVQHTTERIEVRLVTRDGPLDMQQTRRLTEVIQTALGHAFQLELVYFEREIPRGPSGKYEEVVSLVQA